VPGFVVGGGLGVVGGATTPRVVGFVLAEASGVGPGDEEGVSPGVGIADGVDPAGGVGGDVGVAVGAAVAFGVGAGVGFGVGAAVGIGLGVGFGLGVGGGSMMYVAVACPVGAQSPHGVQTAAMTVCGPSPFSPDGGIAVNPA
jgi:hypothetical protein